MSEHFLSYIEIEQFKCFSNFKAEGFKRVNLIGGKNNVGKTAFMEACYVNVHGSSIDTLITALISIKYMRENINLINNAVSVVDAGKLLDTTKFYRACSNVDLQSYFIEEGNAKKEYCLKIGHNADFHVINSREMSINIYYKSNIAFIDNFGWTDDDLIKKYKVLQLKDEEDELNIFIKEFDDSIDNFKVIGDKPQCKVAGEYLDITEFGDGLKHYISIICALYACENGYLFIDEIDNGIHYTQLDRLWELILTLSKKTNCQVFATTHSKEMLESFALVAKNLDEQDISYTILVKNKQQEIKTISLDYEAILDSIIDQGHEVR
jgi:AAA15 family ATPase/GTPase